MRKFFLSLFFVLFGLVACMDEPIEYANTPQGNFDALWNIIDSKYCYLDYKNINWDSIHSVYNTRLKTVKTNLDFFDLLGAMLAELKDGHVNLYSDFDRSRYWKWFSDYPDNFDSDIVFSDRYLGDNYRIAGGFRYGKIDNGNIGYIYYGSFQSVFSDNNMAYVLNYFSKCSAIILDVRDNGGGSVELSKQLASYFFETETVTGYMKHKTGAGHSDFSEATKITTPTNKNVKWLLPVAVLTNRMSYSATNDFVNRMKQAPYATTVGDKTGGGGGLPLSSELPIGWLVRFSACPMFNVNMEHTEWGIEPDVYAQMADADAAKNIDSIIETAIQVLKVK